MTQTIARITKAGKHFEIIVDADKALEFKKGQTSSIEPEGDKIFTDSKKGFAASEKDLQEVFGTDDANEIAGKIVKEGEVLLKQEQRDEEKEKKKKRVVEFLSKNAVDPKTGTPHTPERITSALEQAHVNLKDSSVEEQIQEIVSAISNILPIKIATKKVKIKIPAMHTGKSYSLINLYKEKENWLNDGTLEVVVNIPAGLVMDFYDKLNSVTHGSAITEEVEEDDK